MYLKFSLSSILCKIFHYSIKIWVLSEFLQSQYLEDCCSHCQRRDYLQHTGHMECNCQVFNILPLLIFPSLIFFSQSIIPMMFLLMIYCLLICFCRMLWWYYVTICVLFFQKDFLNEKPKTNIFVSIFPLLPFYGIISLVCVEERGNRTELQVVGCACRMPWQHKEEDCLHMTLREGDTIGCPMERASLYKNIKKACCWHGNEW